MSLADSIGFHLLCSQDNEWLRQKRSEANSLSILAGVTQTRASGGFPMRWCAGWVEAVERELGWDNASRTKELTRARARFVIDNYLRRPSRQRQAICA